MKKLDVRLFRMIKHAKGQFISIVSIVAAALCIYVLFSITTLNINSAVDDYYEMTNINHILVDVVRIPAGTLKELHAIPGVKEVQGRVSFDVPLHVADKLEDVNVRLMSLPDTGEMINKLYHLNGTNDSSGNANTRGDKDTLGEKSTFVLQQFADARSIKPGDTLTPFINGVERPLNVAGIVASPEFIYLMENDQALLPNPDEFGILYVSEAYAQALSGYNDSYNQILITLWDPEQTDDVVEALETKLDPYGVKRITKLEDQLSNNVLEQKMVGIEKMSKVMPLMFLMVGAIIIVIMLNRIISNDRVTIGVLKALGYTNGTILLHYTKFIMAMGIVGAFIGIFGGYLLSKPLSEVFVYYFNIPFVVARVYPTFFATALFMTVVFCVASGLFGAKGVLKIMPADAMRAEAPKSGKRILLERIGFVWKRIGFSWKIVIRNVLRTKRRFTFLAFGLAMAYAINAVPLYMADMMPLMFTEQYDRFQLMDYTIDFGKPVNESAKIDIRQLVDTTRVEGRLEFPFELRNRWYKETIGVLGVEAGSEFYRFYDAKDRPVIPEPGGILLTEGLARSLRVKEGDLVQIKNFLPGKEDVYLPVHHIVKQYLGSNAFMDLDTMQSLLLDRQMITGVAIASEDDVKGKLEDVTNVTSVRSITDIKDSFLEFLNTITVTYTTYMVFGGILAFSIIYNSTIIGISERKTEFSSLRVMGFDKSDIFRIVTRENLLLTALAILMGIPLGMGMIQAMSVAFSSDMITFPVIMSPKIFIIAAVATLFFVFIAQLAARKKIYTLDFIEALKSRIS